MTRSRDATSCPALHGERAPELRLLEEFAAHDWTCTANGTITLRMETVHDAWAAHALRRERDAAEDCLKIADQHIDLLKGQVAAERELRLAAEAALEGQSKLIVLQTHDNIDLQQKLDAAEANATHYQIELATIHVQMDSLLDAHAAEKARAVAAEADRDRLRFALQMLYDDCVEYSTINNLGGENNHVRRVARAALQSAAPVSASQPVQQP